jgi:hypothetical protein
MTIDILILRIPPLTVEPLKGPNNVQLATQTFGGQKIAAQSKGCRKRECHHAYGEKW